MPREKNQRHFFIVPKAPNTTTSRTGANIQHQANCKKDHQATPPVIGIT